MSRRPGDFMLPLSEAERLVLQRLLEDALDPDDLPAEESPVIREHERALVQTLIDKVRNLSH